MQPEDRMAKWARAAIEVSGFNQGELAYHLGTLLRRPMSRETVNKLLAGKRKVLADEMLAIAQLCGARLPSLNDHKRTARTRQNASRKPSASIATAPEQDDAA